MNNHMRAAISELELEAKQTLPRKLERAQVHATLAVVYEPFRLNEWLEEQARIGGIFGAR